MPHTCDADALLHEAIYAVLGFYCKASPHEAHGLDFVFRTTGGYRETGAIGKFRFRPYLWLRIVDEDDARAIYSWYWNFWTRQWSRWCWRGWRRGTLTRGRPGVTYM